MTAGHYTAVLEVSQTVTEAVTPPYSSNRNSTPEPPKRSVVEVARVVIRAETLAELATKLGAHVALIED